MTRVLFKHKYKLDHPRFVMSFSSQPFPSNSPSNLFTMLKLFLVTLCALVASSVAGMAGCGGPPPNNKNPSECCEIPKMLDPPQFAACEAKYGKPGAPPPQGDGLPPAGPPAGCCYSECIFNATKALTNGDIDVAALKSYMKGRYSVNNDWAPIIDKAIEECAAEVKNGPPMPSPPPPQFGAAPTKECDPKFGHMLMCCHQKTFRNCPATVYKASPECDDLKKFAEKCPIPKH